MDLLHLLDTDVYAFCEGVKKNPLLMRNSFLAKAAVAGKPLTERQVPALRKTIQAIYEFGEAKRAQVESLISRFQGKGRMSEFLNSIINWYGERVYLTDKQYEHFMLEAKASKFIC